MLTKDKVEQLLNRSLTEAENTNFKMYLNIATQQLSSLICIDLTCNRETREYPVRPGYRTIFTAPFTGEPVITVNDEIQDISKYTLKQYDRLSVDWFNSIVFKQHLDRTVETITVEADWGFDCVPDDLAYLLADIFNNVTSSPASEERIKSKKIEDYTVTYNENSTVLDSIKLKHQLTITKYSLCNGVVRNGSVCSIY